jgi:hypothetical protein
MIVKRKIFLRLYARLSGLTIDGGKQVSRKVDAKNLIN